MDDCRHRHFKTLSYDIKIVIHIDMTFNHSCECERALHNRFNFIPYQIIFRHSNQHFIILIELLASKAITAKWKNRKKASERASKLGRMRKIKCLADPIHFVPIVINRNYRLSNYSGFYYSYQYEGSVRFSHKVQSLILYHSSCRLI